MSELEVKKIEWRTALSLQLANNYTPDEIKQFINELELTVFKLDE